jgi:hypothetical protein
VLGVYHSHASIYRSATLEGVRMTIEELQDLQPGDIVRIRSLNSVSSNEGRNAKVKSIKPRGAFVQVLEPTSRGPYREGDEEFFLAKELERV